MTYLVAFGIIFLLAVIVIQIGKLSELAAKIRGEEVVERASNDTQGKALMVFMAVSYTHLKILILSISR